MIKILDIGGTRKTLKKGKNEVSEKHFQFRK